MTILNPAEFNIDEQPEVFIPPREAKDRVNRAIEAGKGRRLADRLYTTNVVDSPEVICRRNWARIAGEYFPGAVIVGRTAIEMRPADDGSVFLDAPAERDVTVPGLRIRPRPGPGPVEGDGPFMGSQALMSSRPRAFIENMRPSRSRGGAARRTLTQEELEHALDAYGRFHPADLNKLRDQARELAPALGAEADAGALDQLIGALQGTREGELKTSQGRARARGLAYDPERIETFEKLGTELLRVASPAQEDVSATGDVSVFAFYEAYFSNYIEGTEFTVEEAEGIVFRGELPAQRPKDAHDILGTYLLASDPRQRQRVPRDADQFIDILQSQHGSMLRERPEIGPGEWKQANNHAGGRYFVDKELVEGTLRQAFPIYESVPAGFARAVFAMFVVAEVHPFADGNGRMARLLMNSELTAAEQQRIIVTTRRRGDYVAALRGMSSSFNLSAYVTNLASMQRETATIDFANLDSAQRALSAEEAFEDPDAARGYTRFTSY